MQTNSPHYIKEVTKPFSIVDIAVQGANLYTETEVEYKVAFRELLSDSMLGSVSHYPEIKLEVKDTNDEIYDLILKDCRIKISNYGEYGYLYAKGKYLQKIKKDFQWVGDINPYTTNERGQRVESLSYKTIDTSRNHIAELELYIRTSDLLWDFSYVEFLINKMSNQELENFICK